MNTLEKLRELLAEYEAAESVDEKVVSEANLQIALVNAAADLLAVAEEAADMTTCPCCDKWKHYHQANDDCPLARLTRNIEP